MTHRYAILPALTHPVILGMDALEKLRVRMTLGHRLLVLEAATLEIAKGVTACTPAQAEPLQQLLDEELPKFQTLRETTQFVEHTIRLKSTVPLKQRYTPRNPAIQQIINEEVNKMLAEEIIEPSQSPWSSPVVLVRKKNGKRRLCIDFRRVNLVTEKDAYPLAQVETTLSKLREARFNSTIDLANGYWQVPLAPEIVQPMGGIGGGEVPGKRPFSGPLGASKDVPHTRSGGENPGKRPFSGPLGASKDVPHTRSGGQDPDKRPFSGPLGTPVGVPAIRSVELLGREGGDGGALYQGSLSPRDRSCVGGVGPQTTSLQHARAWPVA